MIILIMIIMIMIIMISIILTIVAIAIAIAIGPDLRLPLLAFPRERGPDILHDVILHDVTS